MSNAIERTKAHADSLGSVPHNQQFRADLYDLLAQLSEAQARLADATAYTRRLAVVMHRDHYAHKSTVFEPLDDLLGLLSQIDNMLTGCPAYYAAPVSPEAQVAQCAWHENDDGFYSTGCGHQFEFIDGGPADNGAEFCQYCGKKIDQHYYDDCQDGE